MVILTTSSFEWRQEITFQSKKKNREEEEWKRPSDVIGLTAAIINIKLHIEIGRQGNCNCNDETNPANRLLFHSSLDNHMQFAMQLFSNVEGFFSVFVKPSVMWCDVVLLMTTTRTRSRRRMAIYNMLKTNKKKLSYHYLASSQPALT